MIGRTISHYEVVSQIGQGGMGVVYKAKDLALPRFVALKVLPADAVGDLLKRRRFIQEARAVSTLNHPNIVTIHDVISEEDLDVIVMELVAGDTLAARVPAGRGMPVDEVLALGSQVADALAVAHGAGIIHRDLKPGNVMVAGDGHVKVLDFGLAKLAKEVDVDTGVPTEMNLTRAGTVLGTLDYMSPEQALGQEVDTRSDIFALGAVLYEMATGRRPFAGDSAPVKLHNIAYSDPRPLGEASGEPGPLGAIIGRCLAKDRDDRFQTMAEVGAILKRLAAAPAAERAALSLDALLPASQAATVTLPAAVPRRRVSRVGVLSAAALAMLITVVVYIARTGSGSAPEESAAETDPGVAVKPPSTAFEHYRAGNGELERYYRSGAVDRAIDHFQQAVDLDAAYAPPQAGLARAHWRQYRLSYDRAWLETATAHVEKALTMDEHLTMARATRGLIELALGEHAKAESDFQATLAMDPANADAHRGMADLRSSQSRFPEAEKSYIEAVAFRPNDQELYGSLGTLYYRLGRYEDAAEQFRRTTEVAPDYFGGFRNLGGVLHMLGRYSDAATALQKALEIQPDPSVYTNLGTLYYYQGLYAEARTALEKALELGANQYLVWGNLGDVYRMLPDRDQDARDSYLRAAQILGREREAQPDDIARLGHLAEYRAKLGDRDQAQRLLDEAENSPHEDADTLYNMTQAYEALGSRPQALEALRRALEKGYALREVRLDPELLDLREDVEFHRMMMQFEEDTTSGG